MYYKFSGVTQRLVGAAASAAYNPQVTGPPPPPLGALAAVTFAVLLLARRRSLPQSRRGLWPPGSAQSAEAAGLGSSPARRRAEGRRGELEVPGECMLPGRRALGGCCGDCLACRPRPPRQGLRDLVGVCFAGEGSSAAPVRVRRAASEPGLSGDLGQGETLRAAVHLLVQC